MSRFVIIHVESAVFKIIIPVFFRDVSQNSAGISCSNCVSRDVLCYNTSGSDDGIVSNGNTGIDDAVAADPHIVPDRDSNAILITAVSGVRMQRVTGRIKTYIWCKHHIFSDTDFCYV